MITVDEAKKILFNQHMLTRIDVLDYDKCVGYMLAEDIFADRAMPPFDRVTMDGIAINFADYEKGIRTWKVIKTQYAGEPAAVITEAGTCVEVMTGAVLPIGCNTIIRYEDLIIKHNVHGEKEFQLADAVVKPGQNVHQEGSDKKSGEPVLKNRHIINATDIALLATVGKQQVSVYSKLKIVIIATGDELTPMNEVPDAFQLRASNHDMIAAAVKETGIEAHKFLMRDNLNELKALVEKCLQHYDIIVLTGAVSKGKADFIPEILTHLNVENLFHGVAQRPAKPFWFGKKDKRLVFAMPGNPVSAAVCTYVYLLPYIRQHMGYMPVKFKARVEGELFFKPALTYFMQAKVKRNDAGGFIAIPFQGNGSGDLTNLSEINAFVELPSEQENFAPDLLYDIYFTRNTIY